MLAGPQVMGFNCKELIAILIPIWLSSIAHSEAEFDHNTDLYKNHTQSGIWKRASCSAEPSHRTDCYPEPGASQSNCEARGCCWKQPLDNNPAIKWCFYPGGVTAGRCHLTSEHRSDCHPELGASEQNCLARGCCWESTSVKGAPYCYLSSTEDYHVDQVLNGGKSVLMSRNRLTHWPRDLKNLRADVTEETANRLRLKIFDPNNNRYEVPVALTKSTTSSSSPDYTFKFKQQPFGFTATRKSSHSVIFDATLSPLVFSDQMIQITVGVPTSNLYGIGENRKPFRIQTEQGPGFTLWARDIIPKENTNLYGSHPFVLGVEDNGNAFGIFLYNSNAMRIEVLPTNPVTIRYRTTGGILDFYIFTGPTPDDVIDQYWSLIGRPPLPPYWSLGYHLCRWKYGGNSGLTATIKRMRDNNMPLDTVWTDIDYMINKLDWTYDHSLYSQLPDIVKDLHNHGQKFVMILDPGISSVQPHGQYSPYDDGIRDDIFVKKSDGSSPIIGEVWPGLTAFPDFSHPKAEAWWERHARQTHSELPFDGLWIDMNEPSNFKDGSTSGCTGSSLDNPPYTPQMEGGSIYSKTLCPSAKHYSDVHYNVHNLYGYYEGKLTYNVLKNILGKRPFILSRSTFAGSGNHVAHWEGDNYASFADMYFAITEIMSFNMFGIPFTGVDICGFRGKSDEELCTRWLQVGAFFPFMRSHNSWDEPDKDPMAQRFSSAAHNRNRESLRLRYRLLPFLYSVMSTQKAVVRPLVFQYPTDQTTYDIDKQFMWGKSLLISPVLERGHTSVHAYFPSDAWYDFFTGASMTSTGQWRTLSAPIDKINVHIRGGTIVPTQVPDVTTQSSRQNDFGLIVAPSGRKTASGFLYWDDGETIDAPFNKIEFKLDGERLTSTVTSHKYSTTMTLGSVDVYGVATSPTAVRIDGTQVAHTYDSSNKVLHATRLKVDLLKPFVMTW